MDHLPRRHATRLRHYWRSAGWAYHDNIDIDLMSRGLIEEVVALDAASRFILTAHGREALGATVVRNRRARSRHADIIRGVAQHLTDVGRLVFTELAVHTAGEERWQRCKPDVFSLVRGLRPDYLAPQVHEIKVSRADLLGELRNNKTARYHELAGELFFVIRAGIAVPEEIPEAYGVVEWHAEHGYRLLRAAPRRDYALETRHWMALARATPFAPDSDSPQRVL